MMKKRKKKRTTIRDKLSINNRKEGKINIIKVARLRKQFSIKRH